MFTSAKLASMKQPKDSLQRAKPTRNSRIPWLTQYLFSVFNIPNAKQLQLRLLIGKRKKKDSQPFGSLLCSRCLGRHAKKQWLKRKVAFWVCSQACHTTSSTAIFSTAVGISVLLMLRLQVGCEINRELKE